MENEILQQNNPLIKEVGGRTLMPTIVSDIDGTINDEQLLEADRIGSIQPAVEAFKPWTLNGYTVSLMSSRTLPEIQEYATRLGVVGYQIGEDGGVIALPSNITDSQLERIQAEGIEVREFQGKKVVLNSATSVDTISEVVHRVQNETGKAITSTVTSTPEGLQQVAGHDTLEMAKYSMARLASAYAVEVTPEQLELLQQYMAEQGIRVLLGTHDSVVQFFGTTEEGLPADKSAALALLNKIISIVDNVDGMLPIVFGNGKNDIPLWNMALQMDGKAVLIPQADGKTSIPEELIPEGVVRATKPAGKGIAEVCDRDVKPWLQSL